jgi:hypothetical protein
VHSMEVTKNTDFVSIYKDKKHKYKNGYWMWKENANKLEFKSYSSRSEAEKKLAKLQLANISGTMLEFVDHIDEMEEEIFRDKFKRPSETFYDGNVITIQDVKNFSLFTLKTHVSRDFIEFLHTSMFDKLLHAIIFYIDLFLNTIELILIRRDDVKIRDAGSIAVERFISKQLSDRRLLIAREYSNILLNHDDSTKDDNRKANLKNIIRSNSASIVFFESLIDFIVQCTYITMHRRCYNTICE